MGFGYSFILLIIGVTFVTVSPYPTDLTDNIFYNFDLSNPEPPSDTGALLMPIAPPGLGETDDGLTALSLSSIEPFGDQIVDEDLLAFYDESNKDALDGLVEPVAAALAVADDFVAMDLVDCATPPSRRQARSEMALGTSTFLQRVLWWG